MNKDEKIAELESEVKNLKADLKSLKLLTEIYMAMSGTRAEKKDYEKVIRHEICEKIREFCRDNFTICLKDTLEQQREVLGYNNCLKELRELLDKIERGEE